MVGCRRDADARAHPHRYPLEGQGAAGQGVQSLGDSQRVGGAGAGHEDRELVTAEAGERVVRTQAGAHPLTEGAQEFVARPGAPARRSRP